MGRKRPNNRRRRAQAARLEAAARLGVQNFNPGDHSPTADADVLEVPLDFSPILTPGGRVSYGRAAKPSPAPLNVVPESPATPSRGLTACEYPSTGSSPTPTWDRPSTEDPDVLEVPLELSPILTPGRSVPYGRIDKRSPAQRTVVPEPPATPPRGNRPPLRVHRPRREPAEYDHVLETPRSRRPQTSSWEYPRLRLKRLRHTHIRAPTSKRCLAKDPRFHLFPEVRPAGLRHLAPHEPPDRPVRVLVRLHEERRFIVGYFLDSHPSDQRDCDSPGSSQTSLQSHEF